MLRLFIITLFCLLSEEIQGQDYITSLNHYTLEDGLSHNQVHWVYQDSRGMLWVGVANGINRYDGKEFKLVLEDNFFYVDNTNTFEDHSGDLWLVRDYWKRELFFFNIHTEQVKTIKEKFETKLPFETEEYANAIILADSTLIISTLSGKLFSYLPSGKFTSIDNIEPGHHYKLVNIPGSNDFFVFVGNNKNSVDESAPSNSVLYYAKNQKGDFNRKWIRTFPGHARSLGLSKAGTLLLDAEDFTFLEFDKSGKLKKILLPDSLSKDAKVLAGQAIYSPEKDQVLCFDNGHLYGIPRENPISFFQTDYLEDLDFHNYKRMLFKDNELWIGSIYGLSKLQLKPGLFKKIVYKDPLKFKPKEFTSCRLIQEHIRDSLFEVIKPVLPAGVDPWAFYIGKEQKIWLGDYFGMAYLDKEGALHRYDDIAPNGLSINSRVYQYFKDRQGQLWVVSASGLFEFEETKGLITKYSKDESAHFLPANQMRHMYQDEEGIYWIASYKGLIRWDKEKNKHRLYTMDDGFLNNHIMAVYEDDYGFLWMSTDNGIIQFDKKTEKVKVFLPEDGITHREFNRGAHYRDSLGNIYFGSLNGITYFNPKDFKDNFYDVVSAPLLLTECSLISGSSQERENQMETYLNQKGITLQPGDRHLQFDFALLDYGNNNPQTVQYSYRLNQEPWNIQNENRINFSGLDYGSHTLEVKARTGNGSFSQQQLSIPIIVLKPFYLKAWFITLVLLIFILGLILFQKTKTNVFLRRQQALEEQVKERTATISAQAEELRQLDKAKSRFLANISHEFRTPLTLILNTLRNEETRKVIDAKEQFVFSKTDHDIMDRNAQRLQQLIEQLLDLSKLEAGKMTLQQECGDFLLYLKELTFSFMPLASQNKVKLNFVCDLSELIRDFDRDKMDKIVYNLLSNAIKFTPEDGEIIVRLYEQNDLTILEVQDSGLGIPEEHLPNIFDRFYQVNPFNDFTYEGTGLGLALVKELVDIHDGKIEVKSETGQGTCFKIYLPLQKSKTLNTPSSLAQRNLEEPNENKVATYLSDSESNQDQPILLIIEDNADLLYHHQKTFVKDYRLLLAKDGEEGLQKAFDSIPDLILCDVMMPGKNGYEVCQQLRSDERTNHIPIILLTAKTGQEEKLEGLSYGATDYMTKPYDQEELALRIQNILEHRLRLQQRFDLKLIPGAVAPEIITPEQVFMNKCMEVIEAELTNRNFGVEALSSEVGLSRVQLFRKVKSISGVTPTQLIRTYRLEKAKTLLLQSAGNASEVGYMVGFNKPSYFFKCFKDEYGMTVGQFISEKVTIEQ